MPGRITTRGGPLPESAASAATVGSEFGSGLADSVGASPFGRSPATTLRNAEAFAAALSSQRMLERSSTIALGRRARGGSSVSETRLSAGVAIFCGRSGSPSAAEAGLVPTPNSTTKLGNRPSSGNWIAAARARTASIRTRRYAGWPRRTIPSIRAITTLRRTRAAWIDFARVFRRTSVLAFRRICTISATSRSDRGSRGGGPCAGSSRWRASSKSSQGRGKQVMFPRAPIRCRGI